jgi:hypothetical protein
MLRFKEFFRLSLKVELISLQSMSQLLNKWTNFYWMRCRLYIQFRHTIFFAFSLYTESWICCLISIKTKAINKSNDLINASAVVLDLPVNFTKPVSLCKHIVLNKE